MTTPTDAQVRLQLITAGDRLDGVRPWAGVWPVNTATRSAAERLAALLEVPFLLEPTRTAIALSLVYDAEERADLWAACHDLLAGDDDPMAHVCLFRYPGDPELPVAATLAPGA